jgi:ferredoxin-NADP reductase
MPLSHLPASDKAVPNALHEGERYLQALLGVPAEVTDSMPWDAPGMDAGVRWYLEQLDFLVVAAFDPQGRPRLSVVVRSGPEFIAAVGAHHLTVAGWHPPAQDGPFAALAIDLVQRTRVKLAGHIGSSGLVVTQCLGNCPKYINSRVLSVHPRVRGSVSRPTGGPRLSAAGRSLVERSDLLFLATGHGSMDVNHRGGSPGFVRVGEGALTLIWPEYSGNRVYSSLGNLTRDPRAAVVFPDFVTGDVLELTGRAEVLVGEQAEAVLPRARVLVRFTIEDWVLREGALDLQQAGEVEYSPYNPPVRRLPGEPGGEGDGAASRARLLGVELVTPTISTLRFQLEAPVRVLPGQHGIWDFGSVIDRSYRHMDDRHPQGLNDDGVRTWTLSSASFAQGGAETDIVECTVRHRPEGAVSSRLNRLPVGFVVPWSGPSGHFTCFGADGKVLFPSMLWIAAGIGVTPFWAMNQALEVTPGVADVRVLLSLRAGDEALAAPFSQTEGLVVKGSARNEGRLNLADVASVPNLAGREVFVCGPPEFRQAMLELLARAGVAIHRIHTESFGF